MNKKDKLINKNKTLSQVKRTSLFATRIGCSKCWKNVTYEHYRVMSDIVWKLTNEGYDCYTEVEFIGGGRGDILAIDHNGKGVIIEVLHTEKEENLLLKKEKYPFPIIKVKTKDFNIKKWDF